MHSRGSKSCPTSALSTLLLNSEDRKEDQPIFADVAPWHRNKSKTRLICPILKHTWAEPTAHKLPDYHLTQCNDLTVIAKAPSERVGLQTATLHTETGASYRGPRYKTHCSSLCIFSRALSIPMGMSWSSPSPTMNTTSLQSNILPPQQPSRWTEGEETEQSQATPQHCLSSERPTVQLCPQDTHSVF